MGQRQEPRLPSGQGIIPTPGHPSGKILPSRTTRRRQDRQVLVGVCQSHLPTQAGLGMVDPSALPPQRRPDLEANRERLPTLRLE